MEKIQLSKIVEEFENIPGSETFVVNNSDTMFRVSFSDNCKGINKHLELVTLALMTLLDNLDGPDRIHAKNILLKNLGLVQMPEIDKEQLEEIMGNNRKPLN